MPPSRPANDDRVGPEPPVMTWSRATPVLGVCALFDFMRLFFTFFWLTGPALAGTAAGAWLSGYIGDFLGSLAGGATALVAGITIDYVFMAFGVVMAMLVALAGWGAVLLWLMVGNRRIFAASGGQFLIVVAGWGVSELPFIGSMPAMTFAIWRMYKAQIKRERAAHAAWAVARARRAALERNLLEAEIRRRRESGEPPGRAVNDNEPPPGEAGAGAANDNAPAHGRLAR